jgi:hypothetical protein
MSIYSYQAAGVPARDAPAMLRAQTITRRSKQSLNRTRTLKVHALARRAVFHPTRWAAVIVRTSSGKQPNGSRQEMELRALIKAVKMADGPCTVVSVHAGIVKLARQGKTSALCKPVWEGLYASMAGKGVTFEWRRRDKSLGQRLAHQLARDVAKGR